MNRQSDQLLERFRKHAVAVIKYCQANKSLPFSVVDQVIRSSSSIGANYAEAQNASSRADFRNKIHIAKKESAETEYWLSIVKELNRGDDISALATETHEITLILQKIVTTLRGKTDT